MRNVIGLVNFHSSPVIEGLTDSRPVGSTPFLGRYAFCDFALSNYCNSGISTIGLLIENHQRSILKHLGSLQSWVSNTKIGRQVIMYNEDAHAKPEINTDLNNIAHNDWLIYDSTAKYIVILPTHVIGNIDLRPIVEEHISRHEDITNLVVKVPDLSKAFRGQAILSVDKDGYVTRLRKNDGKTKGEGVVSASGYVINRNVLSELIHRYLPANPTLDLETIIGMVSTEGAMKVHAHFLEGYVRCIDTFEHYMEYSFELFNLDVARQVFLPDWPIYTHTHDTPPTMYGENAVVKNSFVANGAIIEGTVENSIIARNVKIGKGAVVRNSIIFRNVKVGEDAVVENALIDKYSTVTSSAKVVSKKKTIYAKQGSIL